MSEANFDYQKKTKESQIVKNTGIWVSQAGSGRQRQHSWVLSACQEQNRVVSMEFLCMRVLTQEGLSKAQAKMKIKSHKRITGDQDYVIYTETNRRRRITKKYVAAGSWSSKENEIYLSFLENNTEMFETEFLRRSTKVFRKMSSLLRRRDPEQCRSHHQKLVLKYDGDMDVIIEKLKLKIKKAKQKMQALADKKERMRLRKLKETQQKNKEFIPTADAQYEYIDQFALLQKEDGEIEIKIDLAEVDLW